MKKVILSMLIVFLLVGCATSNKVTFKDNIVLEYGDNLNPLTWIKTGDFDDIELLGAKADKLGSQQVTVRITKDDKVTDYPLTISILDTTGPKISEIKPFEVPLKSEVAISDYFYAQDVRDGDLILESTKLDASRLGSQKVMLWAVDKEGNRTQKEVEMRVIDVNPPIISQVKEFLVIKGSRFELTDYFKVEDEQASEVKLTVENHYDLYTPGFYPVVVVATDPSNNTNRFDTVLTVYENADDTADGYTFIEKADVREDRYTLVNKRYQLPYDYMPENLVVIPIDYRMGDANATLETVAAFVEMAVEANKSGVKLSVNAGFISYWNQSTLYSQAVSDYGVQRADELMPRAGHSEHQLGVALDFCENKTTCGSDFEGTKADRWLQQNAYKFGFILRYPKGSEVSTGFNYVPQHYRFVGKDVAAHFVTTGLTYEEYYHQFEDNLK